MLIDTHEENGRRIVNLAFRRLDAASAGEFKLAMMREIENGGRDLVIDFTEVDFIDSSGLGSLVSILKALSGDGRITLAGLHKKTAQIFKLTRLDNVFTIYPSVTEALEAA